MMRTRQRTQNKHKFPPTNEHSTPDNSIEGKPVCNDSEDTGNLNHSRSNRDAIVRVDCALGSESDLVTHSASL